MAWGCFCWIPCPYKKWNESDRIPMVAMLPLVGTGLGLVTALVWWVISMLTGAAEAPWAAVNALSPGSMEGPATATGAAGSLSPGSMGGPAAATGAAGPLSPGGMGGPAAATGAAGPMSPMDAFGIFGPPGPGGSPIAALLCGAVVTAAYFVMTGFIHLDGFMDVSDAVMPRHPLLEERRRILKDPHTGSFAAVSMALMFLIFGASAAALSRCWAAGALIFIAVATTSRCVSAVSVICCEPMQTSQYAKAGFTEESSFPKALPALIIAVMVTAGCVGAALLLPETLFWLPKDPAGMSNVFGGVSETFGGASNAVMAAGSTDLSGALEAAAGVSGHGPAYGAFGSGPFPMGRALLAWSVIGSAAVCAVTAIIIGVLDRRALGGMNGDISGHLITSGEMAGMLAAAIFLT